METFLLFLKPYAALSVTGGYSLVQVLEALGYLTTSNGIALFDGKLMIIYNMIYLIGIFFIFFINIIASFSLSNKLAFFLFLAWLSPGFLQMYDLINITPSITTYSLGMGRIGNINGALINAFLVVILSWSISTIVLHVLRLEKKFKAFYDHIWYLFGLSAIIFFIHDFDRTNHYKDLEDVNKNLTKSINILSTQASIVEEQCKQGTFNNEFPTICKWIKPAKNYMNKLDEEKEYLFADMGHTPSTDSILNKSKQATDILSNEIEKLNNVCKQKDYSICIKIPLELNRDVKFLNGEDSPYRGYILPVAELMPTIEFLWKQSIQLNQLSQEYGKLSYKRWLAFMFLAFLIGIKISNSSREIFKGKQYSVYFHSLKCVWKLIWKIVLKLISIFRYLYKKIPNIQSLIINMRKG